MACILSPCGYCRCFCLCLRRDVHSCWVGRHVMCVVHVLARTDSLSAWDRRDSVLSVSATSKKPTLKFPTRTTRHSLTVHWYTVVPWLIDAQYPSRSFIVQLLQFPWRKSQQSMSAATAVAVQVAVRLRPLSDRELRVRSYQK